MVLALCLILAGVWGVFWALVLQATDWGRFLALKRAWLAVVIGFGVDLLILKPLLTLEDWLALCGVVGVSAVGLVARSLWNEHREHQEVMGTVGDGHADQGR